jgi:8-oxo-dGTP pyrophosphatase MutT (NUDIX family)
MARAPLPTWYFALVVVRRGHRFLLTQEKKYGSSWSIPGGRVEPGEGLERAAVREVFEETGVPIQLDGVYRVEHTPGASDVGDCRFRILFAGTPIDDTPPKTAADEESLGAAWLTLEEIRRLPLRGAELCALLESVASGRAVYPLDLLGPEMSV